MIRKYLNYLMVAAFALCAILLIFVQYNFSKNLGRAERENEALLNELKISNSLREIDRGILSTESKIRGAISTGDTSHLTGIDAKINEVGSDLDLISETNRDSQISKYLNRLRQVANEKRITGRLLLKHYLLTGNMQDTSFIANPAARKKSDEITNITEKIYDSRHRLMTGISDVIESEGYKGQRYGNYMILLLLISMGLLSWIIIDRSNKQNNLISQLDSSEKKARNTLQIKANFLANMSHEIRTPLNSILGFTNLLKRQKNPDDAKEFIESIQNAGENLLSIINDILDLSKIEAGMMRIVNAAFSIEGLIHSIENLFSERVKEKGLKLYTSIDPELPDILTGDATRLTQILINLIGNALKFSEHGLIKVEVFKEASSGKTIQVGFRVSDNGIGIGKEKLAAIFERFSQAEDSVTRDYGGTGLGLSIVKNLINMQNGNISVKSELLKGTEFYFNIPYSIPVEQLIISPTPDIAYFKEYITDQLNILVVDDNIMNQSLMKHLLSQWKCGFDIVSNGVDAISNLRINQYDLVLMDIQMPHMDGYTATRHIRKDLRSNVPIIAMTAHAMAGEREKCLSQGLNEYISKPINEQELFRIITKFTAEKTQLDKSQINQEPILSTGLTDFGYMRQISKGSSAYEKEISSQFLDCVPRDIAALELAFHNKDYPEINRLAHHMKTSVAMMGLLPHIGEKLENLENADEQNALINSNINVIKSICSRAVEEVKKFYKTIK